MSSIREIKTGRYGHEVKAVLRSAVEELNRKGAEAIIVGCTELSIISDAIDAEVKLYDSSQVLAEAAVRMAKRQSS